MTTTATLPDTPIYRLRDSLARQYWNYCEAHKLSDELPADDLLRDLHDDPATPERDRHIAWLSAYIVAWEAMESADDAIDRLGKATRLS